MTAVLDHWATVAKNGPLTRDTLLKQLEIREITLHVRDGMRVVDAGCGDGETAVTLLQRFPRLTLVGFDAVPEMVERAARRAAEAGVADRATFLSGDVTNPPLRVEYPILPDQRYDLVYTERVLINLLDALTQRRAIEALWNLAQPGGSLLCVESCRDGLTRLNDLRRRVGLEPITPPWHNRYVSADEMRRHIVFEPEARDFSSTYYLLSRVVNAALAKQEGKEPEYDAPVNQVALSLPPLCEGVGQTWSWCWRKP